MQSVSVTMRAQVRPHPTPCRGIVRYQTGYSDIDICQPTLMHNISESKRTFIGELENYNNITERKGKSRCSNLTV